LQEILSDVRHSTAGSAKIITVCPHKEELEDKRTALLTKARNVTVVSKKVKQSRYRPGVAQRVPGS
jgi:hypothetical protein